MLDTRTTEQMTGGSFQAASAALQSLRRAGVLLRRDNRKRGRSWEAPELIDLVRELEVDLLARPAQALRLTASRGR